MIKQIQDDIDTRKKNLYLDKEGKTFFEAVYNNKEDFYPMRLLKNYNNLNHLEIFINLIQ